MPHIFTYGSLMYEPVWSMMVTGCYDSCEAILPGYERKGIRGEVYPVIVPAAYQSQVRGLVYLDVTAADLARLDRFEGEYYFRKNETAVLSNGKSLPVQAYVVREEYYPLLSPQEWDREYFETKGIRLFMQRLMGSDNPRQRSH